MGVLDFTRVHWRGEREHAYLQQMLGYDDVIFREETVICIDLPICLSPVLSLSIYIHIIV